jgi:simple sugar transport system substrate-binding protein
MPTWQPLTARLRTGCIEVEPRPGPTLAIRRAVDDPNKRRSGQAEEASMKKGLLVGTALAGALALGATASAQEKLGDGMVIYFQMGGTPGGGATLPRTNGARAAAEAFGVELREQFSSWHPETMLNQFREAMAASPDCIEIMGHPGEDAWEPLVAEARDAGIIITSGNASIPRLLEQYQSAGFGYVGVELFAGGYLTGRMMVEHGDLQEGDKAVVYGHFTSGRRQSADGVVAALKDAGLEVDELAISAEVDADPSQAVPVIVGYLDSNPDVKAIGTQHGNVTGIYAQALKAAGKEPGEIVAGGIDLAPATIDGLLDGYVTVTLDQQLYLQGFLPVVQCVLSKKYGITGWSVNTAGGVITPDTIKELIPLIEAGYR